MSNPYKSINDKSNVNPYDNNNNNNKNYNNVTLFNQNGSSNINHNTNITNSQNGTTIGMNNNNIDIQDILLQVIIIFHYFNQTLYLIFSNIYIA
jgi:hypothetical protein